MKRALETDARPVASGSSATTRRPASGLSPFWTHEAAVLSVKLRLPTKTGYTAFPPPYYGESYRDLARGSWFTVNAFSPGTMPLPVSWASLHSSLRATLDNAQQGVASSPPPNPQSKKTKLEEAPLKPPASRTRKIRIYPTPKQDAILREWFGTARWTYNECLKSVEEYQIPLSKALLRAADLDSGALERRNLQWVARTPYDIRNEAMNDLLKAYANGRATGKSFKVEKRLLKNNKSESIVIHSKHWKDPEKIFLAAAFKKRGAETTLKMSKKDMITEAPKYDCRLQRTQYGHYYFCLLLPAENAMGVREPSTPDQMPRIIAIDPGVNTFATCYDPSLGTYFEWGLQDKKRLRRLSRHLDDLVARTANTTIKHKRYRMNRAAKRIRLRIHNLVEEMHKKLVKWLVDNYELVLWPPFNIKSMVERDDDGKRTLSKQTVRDMMTWAFYRFKQRLLMKAAQTNGRCIVLIVSEHLTTKTCGHCGQLNEVKDRVYKCRHCKITLPRDWNAARNIFIKTSTDWAKNPVGLGLSPSLLTESAEASSDLAVLPEMTA